MDLGAGTGKFTRLMADTGATVTAVEPVEAMRSQLAAKLPAVTVPAGTAESIPLPSGSVDALVCAQSFHWFATRAALAEIHRVLKPGGRLGLIGNVRDESFDWVAEIDRIITPCEGDVPRFHKGEWRTPFTAGTLTDLALDTFDYQHVGSAEDVIIDSFMSSSVIAALEGADRAVVTTALSDQISTHPSLAGSAKVEFPYRTEAYWCEPL